MNLLRFLVVGKLNPALCLDLYFDKTEERNLIRFIEHDRDLFYTLHELDINFQKDDYLMWFHDKICQAYMIDTQEKFNKLLLCIENSLLEVI